MSNDLPLPKVTFVSQPDILDCWVQNGHTEDQTDGYQDHMPGRFIPEDMFQELLNNILSSQQIKRFSETYFYKISDVLGGDK